MKFIDGALALAWTMVFIVAIFSCIAGDTPNWLVVFSPLVCIMVRCWMDCFDNRNKLS